MFINNNKQLKCFSKFLYSDKIDSIFFSNQHNKTIIYNNCGSYLLLALCKQFIKYNFSILYICFDEKEALSIFNEVKEIIQKEFILYFPDFTKLYDNQKEISETNYDINFILSFQVLYKLYRNVTKYFIISYISVLQYKVFSFKLCSDKINRFLVNQLIDIDYFNQILFSLNFILVDFVFNPGEFSIRGNIIDVFSFSDIYPFRFFFEKNKIKNIKKFNVETQRSFEEVKSCIIINNYQMHELLLKYNTSFFSYLKNNFFIIFNDFDGIVNKIDLDCIDNNFFINNYQFFDFLSKSEFLEKIQSFKIINNAKKSQSYNLYFDKILQLSIKPQEDFYQNFDLLFTNLKTYFSQGYKNFISVQNDDEKKNLIKIFNKINKKNLDFFQFIFLKFNKGFIDNENKVLIYTYYQIFEKKIISNDNIYSYLHKKNIKRVFNLKIGDYVIHIDYGIGKFLGLQKIKVHSKIQEAIKILFLDDDILYVSIHSLHKMFPFFFNEKIHKMSKLGSSSWSSLKNKVKNKIKNITFDLIKLYTERKQIKGYSFISNDDLNNKLEASFPYEDTQDQISANLAIKKDMESCIPMDRLICGDVGFGKTEIAIRAAFKAVYNFKQVVVLVPTTILAFQHYKSFIERLNNFSVCINYLNRFKTKKEKDKIIQDLKNGKINIIIGTHQLISTSIVYKDLGLLIIDEEHKFGVSIKDKLKVIKTNLDTLTLTATPIPRTLQFSLISARDVSIIKTPPKNRKPIYTVIKKYSHNLIKEIINYELLRNGQVFFVHNRIQDLSTLVDLIKCLVPQAKIRSGHGQMEGKYLEKIFIDFIEGKFDIFISTMIVECGLDIPNVNTIIINNAQYFGMADLHQLRGRVGRSNTDSFCYLLIPEFNILTNEAKKRLESLELFSNLGSGFNISIKDLEIRGAGNLFGSEQSGFIANIGFDLYQKILSDTIEELKINKFANVFEKDMNKKDSINDIQIESDFELFIPDNYINKVEERFLFYKRLSEIQNQEELKNIELELLDRFGVLPNSVKSLLKLVSIKWMCKKIGFDKLFIKNNILLAFFQVKNLQYFESEIFTKILLFIHTMSNSVSLKEKINNEKKTLFLRKEEIVTLEDLYIFLKKIYYFCFEKK